MDASWRPGSSSTFHFLSSALIRRRACLQPRGRETVHCTIVFFICRIIWRKRSVWFPEIVQVPVARLFTSHCELTRKTCCPKNSLIFQKGGFEPRTWLYWLSSPWLVLYIYKQILKCHKWLMKEWIYQLWIYQRLHCLFTLSSIYSGALFYFSLQPRFGQWSEA
jgi:hypothetical protein